MKRNRFSFAANVAVAAALVCGCGSADELAQRDRQIAELQNQLEALEAQREASAIDAETETPSDPEPEKAPEDMAALREEIAKLKELAEVNALDAKLMRERLRAMEEAPAAKQNPLRPYELPPKLRKDWQFVGFSTPEETLETMMWGMREGNFDVAMQSRLDGHQEASELTPEERESSRQSFLAAGAAASEYRLIWKNEVLPEVVYLKVLVQGWGERPQVMGFQNTGSSWKIFGESFEASK